MNTYHKHAPNLFLAKCAEKHNKDDIIEVTTKKGKNHECIVFNLVFERDGFFYYSIIRADGFNVQTRAKAKAEKYSDWAELAHNKSNDYLKAANEGREFLALGEPIKVGHHSEKKHRALIDRNWERMRKSTEFTEKAERHEEKAEYWAKREHNINISMPESLEFYKFKLGEAEKIHADLKSGIVQQDHSFSLTYAKKDVNKFKKLHDLAVILWG
ncbi:DUF3560 domain-containing protein [Gilliamella sp. BG7]|uniref:DUF3560 domain-containing protein n=1 Tax=unclassified Gilliamella TaxID=2685620 RepID=UPI0039880BF8